MREAILEKLTSLLEDEATEKALADVKSGEALRELLREHGIELTEEEEAELKAMEPQQGELKEDELEDVAGGSLLNAVRSFVNWLRNKSGGFSGGGGGHSFGGGRHG